MPGLIDTHIHAPQYPNAGLGLDLPLLEWLNHYTYPLEEKFASPSFARMAYEKVVVGLAWSWSSLSKVKANRSNKLIFNGLYKEVYLDYHGIVFYSKKHEVRFVFGGLYYIRGLSKMLRHLGFYVEVNCKFDIKLYRLGI
jgi:hypothetical protein